MPVIAKSAHSVSTRLTPLTLWHLLSLDAPTVATLWLVFAARATHTALPSILPAAMFLAVWLLYATDRILDTRSPAQNLEPRHHFHRHHLARFAFAILIATSALAVLVPALPVALLRSYLLLAAALLGWLALIHLTPLTLPKEIVPGLFFAAAVFIPVPLTLAAAAAFATLCILNCLYIYAWESPHPHSPHFLTRITIPMRASLTILLAIVPTLILGPSAILVAIALAALALLVLDRYRVHLALTTLRAAADLTLLTPILVMPFLR